VTAEEASIACALLALDCEGLKGAVLKGPGGPAQDAFIQAFRDMLRERTIFRLPPHAGTDRLSGSLDIAETLRTGRPCHDRGLLAEADGGVLLLTSAERLPADKAALIAAQLDGGPSRFAVLVLDEGMDEEGAPAILHERLAFHIGTGAFDSVMAVDIQAARRLLPGVSVPGHIIEGLCQTALALGIASLRPAVMALRAARAAAAIDGRSVVDEDDARLAARLVLAPRARRFPVEEQEQDAPPPPPETQSGEADGEQTAPAPGELSEMLLEAVRASLPEGLLAALEANLREVQAKAGAGAVTQKTGLTRGRPAGTRQGVPRNGARLSLIDTLRSAAPWQPLRRRQSPARDGLLVERGDFRVKRYKQKRQTTAIFAVDASGSAALHRMAEAKGAVELILADCYVRRDQAALIAFRGKTADLLLPPTRSLQRAKKSLADLPGGGGTPLCAGIEQAMLVAQNVRRGGGTPLVVFLTDGKANIARDGSASRAQALRDAETAGSVLKRAGVRCLMIDLSDARGGPAAKIADAMGASYLPLPHADAARISHSVSAAMKA
jgi:magnesium chelatase subunit D